VKRSAKNKSSGVNSEKVVKSNKRKIWLRQDESGPSDESRGPDSITVRPHHSH